MFLDRIPTTLQKHAYWCVWKKFDDGRKMPLNPRTKKGAKPNDETTFTSYNYAKATYELSQGYYSGLGVLIRDGLGAIDIDHCVDENGNITSTALDIISIMKSYKELSPSRMGLRIYFKIVPDFVHDRTKYYINNRELGLEVYVGGGSPRYTTVTGHKLKGYDYPIEDRTNEVEIVLEKYMQKPIKEKQPPKEKSSAPAKKLTDDEVMAKAKAAQNGEEFTKLFGGDIEGYNSQSEADLKLCGALAFWCGGDTAQMDRLFRQSGLMRDKWDELRGEKTYGEATLEKAAQDCKQFYGQKSKDAKKKKHNPSILSPYDNLARYTPDDKGNGYLFADSFRGELRFCPEGKEYYFYDGMRWNSGGGETARERAKEIADYLWDFALKIKDEDKRKRYKDNAKHLRSQPKRELMLKDASTVYPLRLSDLDENHELFNCRNGTLDLKNRKVLAHDSAHMLSKVAGADFVRDAKCERWEKFVDEVMMGDKETVRYLQKLFGYCLTGEPVEEKLFILFGSTTRNGKSTLLDTIASVAGDYARSMLPETLAEPRFADGGKASSDWARMAGIRLATVNEPPKDLQLNAAKVKSVTGRDTITARFLHKEFFEYKPQFALVINTNYKPNITDTTLFASDRIVVIPFNRHFTEAERDKGLKHELRTSEAMSGVLNWMLEGLKLYREEGLEPPESIKAEIARYEHDSDKLALFIEDCIESAPGEFVYMKTVYDAYQQWCPANGFRAESIKKFSPAFEAKGMEAKRVKEGKRVLNIRLTDNSF